jgi:DNA-binding transcriptional ArsR family regulator
MVEYSDAEMDRTLAALADPTRRAILAQLTVGDARVGDVAEPYEMSLNAVSKHLKVLEGAGLVRREVRGREHWLSFDGEPLTAASDWIDHYRKFWEGRLDALAEFLRNNKSKMQEKHQERSKDI